MALAEDVPDRPLDRVSDPEHRLQDALDLAYRYLGHRDRTVAEMRRHLEAKRVEPETIDDVIAELEATRYLDDGRYAKRFAEDKRAIDGWGAERIERRLLQNGVGREHVAAALREDDGHDELAAARAILARRFPGPFEDDRARERALGHLVRKGYDLELAYDAVRAHHAGRDAA
ncbi:regulatory protein RecX [Conexibacter sp. SYSU D00693]|uniref:regulatory protein RecX n=1 Tax=Conexibacter sp. SYSU D00693 TaxID=2812560 RepID=UPI00196B835E|nr:regulatory protein RecX [Conexibacter sp. SYSU D00693]